jgi:signal transduction histidine kinase
MQGRGNNGDAPVQKANILMVDDRPENLVALEAALADLGENLVKARSGLEALKRLMEEEYAVVLLDVKMPGMSGYETAALIRAREKTRHLPIIFITAHGEESAPLGYSLGAADYMYTPVPPQALKAKVAAFVHLWKGWQELIDARAVLEERVQERTRELATANAELHRRAELLEEQAQQLEEADRHRDQFLALLGHELRNPLGAMANALELVRLRGADNPALQRPCDVLGRQLDLALRIVGDLQDISRLKQGKLRLQRERIDLRQVMEAAVAMARPLIEERRHRLAVRQPAAPLWAGGDPARLQQVVGNLLVNAAKYTPKEGTITLEGRQAGMNAVIRVRDTGIGIPAEVLPHVFDLFMQSDAALRQAQGGMGMGLTLVKRLVELHGGCVTVHSRGEGKGSTFVVTLPAAPEG